MENGIIPQISALLTQVVQGVAADSGAGAMANNFMPLLQKFIQNFLEEGLDSLIDAKDRHGNKISASHYSRGRNAVEGAYYARLRRIAGSQKTIDNYVTDDRNEAVKSFFMATGMDEPDATAQLSTPSGFIAKMVYGVLDKGETKQAYNTINNAVARRFDLMSGAQGSPIGTQQRERYTAEVIRNLRKDFYDRQFGGMALGDVSQLLQQLVGTGDYDRIGDNIRHSAGRLRRELKEYSRAFESLRSVFSSGDMKDIISNMDRLAGGSVMALTPAELQHTAKLYQHSALVTGISDRNLMSLTKTMYTQGVGQGGGDERFAANAAVLSSYVLGSKGITTPGVSQVDLERSMARMAGEVAASGETREMAAAYTAYLTSIKGEDTTENFSAFQTELQKSGLSVNAFGKNIYKRAGMTEQQYNEMAASYAVGSMASDARMIGASFTNRMADARKQYTSVQDRVIKDLGFKTEEEARKALGEDWRSVNAVALYRRLGTVTVPNGGDIGKARATLETGIRDIAWRQGSDWYTTAEFLTRVDSSDRLRRIALGDVEGFENARLAPGVQGLTQYVKRYGSDADIGGALSSLIYGVDPGSLRGAVDTPGFTDRRQAYNALRTFASNMPEGWYDVYERLRKYSEIKHPTDEDKKQLRASVTDDIFHHVFLGKKPSVGQQIRNRAEGNEALNMLGRKVHMPGYELIRSAQRGRMRNVGKEEIEKATTALDRISPTLGSFNTSSELSGMGNTIVGLLMMISEQLKDLRAAAGM